MKVDNNVCLKFPSILKHKLQSGEIELPDGTQFEYEDLLTYRAVERKHDDHSEITLADFKSYFELGKRPKKPRGILVDNPRYYGVSSFLKREIVEQKMKFPNPNKKMAIGYVQCKSGPQLTEDQHVCWWLYQNADVSSFKLMEKEKNDG